MKTFAMLALITFGGGSAFAADSNEAADLRRKVSALTAEADALWAYVQSGPDHPDTRALDRAVKLWERRRQWSRR